MSSIHYKFQSSNKYASVTFDGFALSLRDLKEMIGEAKSFAKVTDMDLIISNAQTGEGKEKIKTSLQYATRNSRLPFVADNKNVSFFLQFGCFL